ncbi:MAG: cytochrome C [Deltaproteobacteria bacterium]|nr:MAG: cytochrome C [Deltaproteobacteria bacterium]
MNRRTVSIALGVFALAFVGIQLVPLRVHNPAVTAEPAWDSPQTRELAARACFDCHSNEVKVPWYGHIAPIAWFVNHHVEEGREQMNFSEWDKPQREAHEASEVIAEGEMPPGYYLALHPEARLTDAEWKLLQDGLDASVGSEGGHGERGHGGEHEGHDEDDDD